MVSGRRMLVTSRVMRASGRRKMRLMEKRAIVTLKVVKQLGVNKISPFAAWWMCSSCRACAELDGF
jgi:hypothetical protein